VSLVVANGRRETIGACECVDLFPECTVDVGLLNNVSVTEVLVLNGADPHAVTGQRANVAHWAVSAGHLEVSSIL
jgi:hypothetical protein